MCIMEWTVYILLYLQMTNVQVYNIWDVYRSKQLQNGAVFPINNMFTWHTSSALPWQPPVSSAGSWTTWTARCTPPSLLPIYPCWILWPSPLLSSTRRPSSPTCHLATHWVRAINLVMLHSTKTCTGVASMKSLGKTVQLFSLCSLHKLNNTRHQLLSVGSFQRVLRSFDWCT